MPHGKLRAEKSFALKTIHNYTYKVVYSALLSHKPFSKKKLCCVDYYKTPEISNKNFVYSKMRLNSHFYSVRILCIGEFI